MMILPKPIWFWALVPMLCATGCKKTEDLCTRVCSVFIETEETWADDNCGGFQDSTGKVNGDCRKSCRDVFGDLSDSDKRDVDICVECVVDDFGGSGNYDDINDALTDSCVDECDDEDIGGFLDTFTQDWWSHIDYEDPNCAGGGGGGDAGTGTGGPQQLNLQVFDTLGLPVSGAEVFVNGSPLGTPTTFNGTLSTTATLTGTVGIRVSKPGYVDNVQAITPAPDTGRLVITAPLLPVGVTQTIDPAAPAPISHNGATLIFDADTLADQSGKAVIGAVDISFTYVPPGGDLAAIGNFLIAGRPGEVLVSLGVVAISAVSGGNPVQLAPGATASVTIPADTGGTTPADPPPLWLQNPDTGLWEEAPIGWTLQENSWFARIDALATWNCDYPNRVTCVSGTLVSPDGFPLGGVSVSGYMSGQAANFLPASTVQVATTGSAGSFCMEVVPNSNLELFVTCPGGVKTALTPLTVPDIQGARCASGSCTDLGTTETCCFTDEDCDTTTGQKCINGTCKDPDRCDEQQVAGQDTPETRVVELGKNSGSFTFNWETFSQQDQIVVTYEGTTLFDSTCIGANGSESLSYSGTDTTITVSVNPNCAGGSGTEWNFTVSCPL